MKILTNSAQSNNHSSVHAYYAPYRQELLEGGVDLYELQGTGSLAAYLDRAGEDAHAGLHTKAMVIDDRVGGNWFLQYGPALAGLEFGDCSGGGETVILRPRC